MSFHEASQSDPQQLLLMEVVWECMESAGQVDWRGKEIGCFVGSFGEDWLDLYGKDTLRNDRYYPMGTGDFALANRISYEYDLKGPSITYRTACSSSLVALYAALIFTPTMSAAMSDNMVLSPDGQCKSFDASANGFGRGEGIAAIFIKPVRTAVEHGDRIRAVIRSAVTNCDGATANLSFPSQESQEKLIRKAYRRAGIGNIAETAFVECHGTGTAAGDVVETSAIASAFNNKGVIIGAVKPNVGHTEGASGLVSVIKAALSLEHELIPPNVAFWNPNPKIPFLQGKLHVPVEALKWPTDRKKRVGVNNFGIGGSNAHVVLEAITEAPSNTISEHLRLQEGGVPEAKLLVISATHNESLDQRIRHIQSYLRQHPESLDALAYTLGERRDHLSLRAFMVVDRTSTLAGHTDELEPSRTGSTQGEPPIVNFVFTGQGSHWPGMGQSLISTYSQVKRDLGHMDETLKSLPSPPQWSILDELAVAANGSRIGKPEFAQPLITALQIAVVNLLRSWGIHSTNVIGHSSGEIAAAYAAGAVTMETAIVLAYYRGQVAKGSAEQAMLAVALGSRDIEEYLVEGVVIACRNSPQSVTLSGDRAKLWEISESLKKAKQKVAFKMLPVQVAYHSPRMYSTVTGTVFNDGERLDSSYWKANLDSPVEFSEALHNMVANQENSFLIEIGPHGSLAGPISHIMRSSNKLNYIYAPCMMREDKSISRLLHIAGQAFVHGLSIALSSINGPGPLLTNLPSYPWHRQRVKNWEESRLSHQWRFKQFRHHEILGSQCIEASTNLEPCWRNLLNPKKTRWVWQHCVEGNIVFPCAGYISMVAEAIRQMTGLSDCAMRFLFIKQSLILQDSEEVEILTTMKPAVLTRSTDSSWYEFCISSYHGLRKEWVKHCTGQARAVSEQPCVKEPLAKISAYSRSVAADPWYSQLKKHGLDYGPNFRGLQHITASTTTHAAAASMDDDSGFHDSHYALHPVVIDQCLQLFSVAASKGLSWQMDRMGVPLSIEEVRVSPGKAAMLAEATTTDPSLGDLCGHVRMSSEDTPGLSLLCLSGVRFASVHTKSLSHISPLGSHMRWEPDLNFSPLQNILQTPHNTGIDAIAIISLLETLDLEDITRDLTPKPPHLVTFKSWLQEEATRIYAGRYDFIPGIQAQITATRDERRRASLAMSVQLPNPQTRRFFSSVWPSIKSRAPELFDGHISSLEVMIESNSLEDIYDFSVEASPMKSFFSQLTHSNPQVRILEIGAGTGATTEAILRAFTTSEGVQLFSQYTDRCSPLIQNESKVQFSVLDISKEPSSQGFRPGSYDLVVASNVLHATPQLSNSLRNVRSLLACGGYILIHELCSTVPYLNGLMGLLPGWWAGKDDDRVDQPFVSAERWDQELQNTGFSGTESLAFDTVPPFNMNATIISRACKAPSEHRPAPQAVSFLCRSSFDWQHPWICDLGKRFSREGCDVQWCTLGESRLDHDVIVISLLDITGPFFIDQFAENFEQFRTLLTSSPPKGTLWLTKSLQLKCENPNYALALGMARTIRSELGLDFRTLEVDAFDVTACDAVWKVYRRQLQQNTGESVDSEYALHDGLIHTGRLESKPLREYFPQPPQSLQLRLNVESPGLLSSLRWIGVAEDTCPIPPDYVEIEMRYVGLNFKDLMQAMGVFGSAVALGLEGSGVIRRVGPEVVGLSIGDRVSVLYQGTFTTRLLCPSSCCMRIPDELSLAQAAAVPCVYATAIWSLIHIARIRKGQSVLIHSACGGVGLACLDVCRMLGAEIYVTVGNEEKVQHLVEHHKIARARIFHSRNDSFLQELMQETQGRGVDVVVNSLSGELLHASWSCVARSGQMIEIGRRDMLEHGSLGLGAFRHNRSFHGVYLQDLVDDDPEIIQTLFQELSSLVQTGKLALPLPLEIFEAEKTEKALRHMQKGTHIGKILVQIPKGTTSLPIAQTLVPYVFPPDKTFLLVGGLGGIGRSIATWMVAHGARSLIFLSPSAGKSDGDQRFLRELDDQGCRALTVAGSVADPAIVDDAVASSPTPIAGVVNMSMVLRDRLLEKMSLEEWTTCLAPKVQGTWNLHNTLSKIGWPLEFFIVFSSLASLGGNPGQANYAAANAFLDAFVHYRRSFDMPCSLVSLGAVGDIGCVSRNPQLLGSFTTRGYRLLSESDVLQAFHLALSSSRLPHTLGTENPLDIVVGMPSLGDRKTDDPIPWLQSDARFSKHVAHDSHNLIAPKATDAQSSLLGQIAAMASTSGNVNASECQRLIILELGRQMAQYTANTQETNENLLAEWAVDSLMGLEVKQWVRRYLNVEISLLEISQARTIGQIAALAVKSWQAHHGKDHNQMVSGQSS
ncbi:polyketide synthase [Aspergillus bertholletiae]|uniref:Polyketide synthase n=1 Tax=Aspergillus bertholletiae TaxID=1226010 RepID=A0A5N7BII6_9EURO|nr:polyketide synthase [Aspergillus bertholletiae]